MTDRACASARLLAAVLLAAATTLPGHADAGAWDRLRDARDALTTAGPLVADFEQTYLPAGFSTGETESGRLTVALPDCLRWDYLEPFPKSYLVCGAIVHSWNPGEAGGRRDRVDPESAPGLDLLLLSVDRLAERYVARLEAGEAGETVVALDPLEEAGAFRDARLVLDAASGRPLRLSYHDLEGNLTRFRLTDYRPLEEPAALAPPPDVEWIGR